ncbi:MAG: ATPase domain-containing protein [Vicinamibacterales bacterium]
MSTTPPALQRNVISTGVTGLDDIMGGGFTRNRLFLIEGVPGSGKTTLALQFLLATAARGERVLYVTLSESAEELESVAHAHGWSLDAVSVRELAPPEAALDPDEQNTMFHPSEIELASTTRLILDDVERLQPTCVVFDSLSELRLLAGSALRYRRQILALKQYFSKRQVTVVLLDDMTASNHDLQVQSIAHGVIQLEQMNPEYGAERRRLRVVKYRGVHFRGGYHDYMIRRGGLIVFPRLVAAEHRQATERAALSSGLPALDSLLGGGIQEGTSTLIVGQAGTGKSSLAAQFAAAAAQRGQRATIFMFDESPDTLLPRCRSLGIDIEGPVADGRITLRQVDPAELSPGEFTASIRTAVEQDDARMIVIDSLNGYLNAMPEERFLVIQLHELLMYLGQQGVATLLIGAAHGLVGGPIQSAVDASYLADSVLLLRYFETAGSVRQALSVLKKRAGAHERSIRELKFESGAIRVGPPLTDFSGILSGTPIRESRGPAGPGDGIR